VAEPGRLGQVLSLPASRSPVESSYTPGSTLTHRHFLVQLVYSSHTETRSSVLSGLMLAYDNGIFNSLRFPILISQDIQRSHHRGSTTFNSHAAPTRRGPSIPCLRSAAVRGWGPYQDYGIGRSAASPISLLRCVVAADLCRTEIGSERERCHGVDDIFLKSRRHAPGPAQKF
jgi:hypothetical protein